eukprot:scaffold206199_cov30-Tisochrysis_lutea.AAC.1
MSRQWSCLIRQPQGPGPRDVRDGVRGEGGARPPSIHPLTPTYKSRVTCFCFCVVAGYRVASGVDHPTLA